MQPPVAIRVDDLPIGLREEYKMLRRFNGCDANEPFVQTPQHFENYERLFEKKTVQLAGQVWPELDRIVFESESDFSTLMDHFAAHADERREIAASMRCEVLKNYSYESLMRRMLEWMTCQLEQQAVHADRASRAVVQHPASRGQLTRAG
ncbi:MAG: glycosyltransferase family 1 protein [Planctomycetes bacterium]|nr:glycosyltransferase family 1 protein [Planctomycetota bacterium]